MKFGYICVYINYQLSQGNKTLMPDRCQRAGRESVKSACPLLTPAAVCQSFLLNRRHNLSRMKPEEIPCTPFLTVTVPEISTSASVALVAWRTSAGHAQRSGVSVSEDDNKLQQTGFTEFKFHPLVVLVKENAWKLSGSQKKVILRKVQLFNWFKWVG